MSKIIKDAPETAERYTALIDAFKLLYDVEPEVSIFGCWLEIETDELCFITLEARKVIAVRIIDNKAQYLVELDGHETIVYANEALRLSNSYSAVILRHPYE